MFLIRLIPRPTSFIWSTEAKVRVAFWSAYQGPSREEEEQIKQKRKWLAEYIPESIPRKNCDLFFSRASGPGEKSSLGTPDRETDFSS